MGIPHKNWLRPKRACQPKLGINFSITMIPVKELRILLLQPLPMNEKKANEHPRRLVRYDLIPGRNALHTDFRYAQRVRCLCMRPSQVFLDFPELFWRH